MVSFRPLIALTLVGSLVASDVLTFWHCTGCRGEVAATVGTDASDPHAGHPPGCSHHSNPFAKRHSKRVAIDTEATAPAPCCPDHGGPDRGSSEHDHAPDHHSDDCTLCRWLAMARDAISLPVALIRVERAWVPCPVLREWSQPSSEPLLHDLSRRGPPANLSLS